MQLKKMNMEYALLYPATLRVSVDGKQKKFEYLKDAALLVQVTRTRKQRYIKLTHQGLYSDIEYMVNGIPPVAVGCMHLIFCICNKLQPLRVG